MSDPGTPGNNNGETRRRPWIWLALIGLLIVAAVLAVVVFLPQNGSLAKATETDPPNLAEVVITDLTQEETFNGKLESIKGSGTLVPASQIELSFATPGTVAELLVQMGQEVRAGDTLARVDAEVLAAHDEINVTQAGINLDVAQEALDTFLAWEADPGEIAQLEANVTAAAANYEAALGQEAASGNSIAMSIISVQQAERQLADVQAAYDTAFDPAREWELHYDEPKCYPGQGGSVPCTGPTFSDSMESEREGATVSLQYAQENLQVAQLNYNSTVANAGSSSSAGAESALLTAEQALATALAGPTEEQIAAAETAVHQAELNLRQAQLIQASNLAGATIVAPMDGTIMSISGHLGGPGGTGPFITLADLSQPTLEIFLDETNLDKLGLNSEMEVVFSAMPSKLFTGTVVQVDPQLIASDGLSYVRALVQLAGEYDQTLPAGMNAEFHVVGLSNRIVRLFLSLDDENLLAVGDPVTVELPNLSDIPGTVVFVPRAPTPSNYGPAAFEVLVEIDDPAAAAELAELPDETSVDVIYVSDAVDGVMAIPVSALVALLEGGYAVEVDRTIGGPQLVAVEVGFFGSNNMIAVTSDGLEPGDRVLVP